MSKTNAFETALLKHIFQNADIDSAGTDSVTTDWVRGGAVAGSFEVALYTASPGESGSGSSANEATYTSYARVNVARTAGGWTVSGNTVSNAAKITFPACTGGSNTITHFAILGDSSDAGAGNELMLFWGALTTPLAVSTGITPEFAIGALTITED